ncbi:MAG: hypothetical protein HZA36_01265 [Parcubacteria group bacterium]|nr:hypothetical protein [Parcubacteria group bacterium]
MFLFIASLIFLVGYIAVSFYFGISTALICIGYVISSIFDVHSTVGVVGISHFECEMNPLARWCMKRFGVVTGLISLKAIGACGIVTLLFFGGDFSTYAPTVFYFGNIFITCVAILNYTNWFLVLLYKDVE